MNLICWQKEKSRNSRCVLTFCDVTCFLKIPENRTFHLVIEIDLNLFFCHCSKSATNLALGDWCSGIVPGCKTTTSTAKTMERMHLSFCRELRLHPRRCLPRMPLQRNRKQRSQQLQSLKLRNHRPKVLSLQQSPPLVSLTSPCLYIFRFYSFVAFSVFPALKLIEWLTAI